MLLLYLPVCRPISYKTAWHTIIYKTKIIFYLEVDKADQPCSSLSASGGMLLAGCLCKHHSQRAGRREDALHRARAVPALLRPRSPGTGALPSRAGTGQPGHLRSGGRAPQAGEGSGDNQEPVPGRTRRTAPGCTCTEPPAPAGPAAAPGDSGEGDSGEGDTGARPAAGPG